MSAKQARFRFGIILLGLCLLALGGQVLAQGTVIQIGQNATGSIDAAGSTVQYELTSTGGDSATIQVLALQLGFTPTFRVLDPSGVEVLNIANTQGLVTISGNATFTTPGLYTIEVGGANGSTGQFALSVQPGAPAPQAIPLVLNLQTTGMVNAQTPLQIYSFDTSQLGAVTLTLLSQTPDSGPLISVKDMSANKTVASNDASIVGVSYSFPANGHQYQVSVRAVETASSFSICIGACAGGIQSGAPTGGLPSQPVPTSPPVAPQPTVTLQPAGCAATPNINGSVNLRAGPGTNYLIQSTLPNGQSAPVLAQVNFIGWYEVNFNGATLWVGSSVVTLNGDCSALPLIPPPANAPLAPTAVPTATPTMAATATSQPTATPTNTEVPDGPDLAVQGMTIVQDSPSHARVTFDVKNLGTVDVTQPFYVYVCITALCVEKQVTLAVRAGSATEVFVDLNHPSSTTPETVAVAVDSRGEIRELNENNNTTSLSDVSLNF